MSVQETVRNTTANLSATTAALLVGVVALVVVTLGAEQIFNLFDFRFPWRQLMVGRTLHALTLSFRFFCSMAASYITAAWETSNRDRPPCGRSSQAI